MTIQAPQPITAAETVGEFFTDARLDALNAALATHGVDASRIITIFEVAAQPVANALPARYRVLFRKS